MIMMMTCEVSCINKVETVRPSSNDDVYEQLPNFNLNLTLIPHLIIFI